MRKKKIVDQLVLMNHLILNRNEILDRQTDLVADLLDSLPAINYAIQSIAGSLKPPDPEPEKPAEPEHIRD